MIRSRRALATGLAAAAVLALSSPGAAAARAPASAPPAPAAPAGATGASGPASDVGPTDPSIGAWTPDPASGDATSGDGDPLVGNGLGSPLCRSPAGLGDLGAAGAQNCRSSGFVAAQAPAGNYGIDVHIDTGVTSIGADLAAVVEDILLTPVWTALVWIVHALIVGLEWCYSLNFLDHATMGQVAGALSSAQRTVTQPWLATVLALAAVAAAYHGLIRRRVAQTLGEAALVLLMTVAGLTIVLDPQGTVGEASAIANAAGLGTLGAMLSGDPAHAERSLASAFQELYAGAIRAPWCYLEFGDVGWCRDPARLDPRLRRAALALAREPACPAATGQCAPAGAGALVSHAAANADLVLAFPANGPARNSINDPRSLLAVLCGGPDMASCRGPTAAAARFRTEGGLWPRAGGLLFILAGSIGMVALLGFIALRLLGAAIASLFYLLLAPLAVLAPALGEGGRAAFRNWSLRLLGALVAKLLFSVFLGATLLVLGVLSTLGSLGWWTQWLLIAAFWWIVFGHRHRALEMATLGHRDTASRGLRVAEAVWTLRQVRGLAPTRRGSVPPPERESPRGRPRLEPPAPWRPPRGGSPQPGGASRAPGSPPDATRRPATDARQLRLRQVSAGVAGEREEARGVLAREAARRTQITAERARAEALANQAASAADPRRALRLSQRAGAVRMRAEEQQAELDRAAVVAREPPERAARRWSSALDAAASLPRGARAGPGADGGARRDYAALAPVVGVAARAYRRSAPGEQLRTRARIDRELEARGPTLAAPVIPGRRGAPPVADQDRVVPVRDPRPESVVLRRERQFLAALRARGEEDRE